MTSQDDNPHQQQHQYLRITKARVVPFHTITNHWNASLGLQVPGTVPKVIVRAVLWPLCAWLAVNLRRSLKSAKRFPHYKPSTSPRTTTARAPSVPSRLSPLYTISGNIAVSQTFQCCKKCFWICSWLDHLRIFVSYMLDMELVPEYLAGSVTHSLTQVVWLKANHPHVWHTVCKGCPSRSTVFISRISWLQESFAILTCAVIALPFLYIN